MKQQNRKIIILMDKCLAHPKVEILSNMTVKFLMPNTGVLQPLEQGIIKKIKVLYEKILLTSVVANSNNFRSIIEFLKTINLLDAVL